MFSHLKYILFFILPGHGVCRVLSLPYSHFSLRLQLLLSSKFSSPLNVIPEVLPLLLMGSGLSRAWANLEPAGIASVRHRGIF